MAQRPQLIRSLRHEGLPIRLRPSGNGSRLDDDRAVVLVGVRGHDDRDDLTEEGVTLPDVGRIAAEAARNCTQDVRIVSVASTAVLMNILLARERPRALTKSPGRGRGFERCERQPVTYSRQRHGRKRLILSRDQ